jgi:hypothetical protein
MRLFKLTTLALLLASPLAMAQTAAPAPKPASPAAMQLAQKMVDLGDSGKVFNVIGGSIFQDMMGALAQEAGDKASCPALKPQVEQFGQQLSTMFNGYNDASFRQDVAKVYADVYTEKEMKEITTFMQSPTGRKMISKQGELTQRIGMLGQNRVKAHDTEIRTAYAGFESRMKTTLATCPAAPPAVAPAKK